MEKFIRRCTQYSAKIDINDMSVSQLKRQQFNDIQQKQQHLQQIAFDNHFQIAANNNQQQQTDQYSYKIYNYHQYASDDLNSTQQHRHYNNNVQQQKNIEHRTTDKNNNFGYTTATTTATATNAYCLRKPIYDDDWLTTKTDLHSVCDNDYTDSDIFDDAHIENDLYVAIKNDIPSIKDKNIYTDFLKPTLKALGFYKCQQNLTYINEYNNLNNNTNNINKNDISNNNENIVISNGNNYANLENYNINTENITMVYEKNNERHDIIKKKQYMKYHNNNNNKQQHTASEISKSSNALLQCRKNVLSVCNTTLKKLFTSTMPTATTISSTHTTVTLYKRKHHCRNYQQRHSPFSNIKNHHRKQQQFRLLPYLGTTSFLTLLTLICLETLLLTTVTDCAKTFYMHWNTSNSIFRIDNTDHIIDVNKGNLAFEFDQVHIICPVYEPGTYENETEKYIIYNVSKVEYETCRITNADPRVIAICDKPQKLMFFTITFRPFTPQPGGLEFLPGNDYYFISTSSKDDLYRRIGGRCSTNNMKVVFKVCCAPEDKNKTNISTSGGGVGNNNAAIGGSNMATSGIVTSDTSVNMENGGGAIGGHQTHTTQQFNKNMHVIGVNTAIMPTGGASGTNSPLKPIKNGGVGGGSSINTNMDQFNRIPLQQQTHGINNFGNNMANSMGQIPHGHTHGHPNLDGVNNNGINSAINVVNGNSNVGGSGIGNAGNGIMLTPNHGMLPANGIGISGYSNIGHANGEMGIGTGIRINNVPTQQYHPPYKQGNNNKLNTNGDEHHFNKHPNEVVKNEELTYNSAAYSLHKSSTTATVVTFIWKLCKNTCLDLIHVYHKFNSQIEIPTIKPTNEHLLNRKSNAFNCILTKNNRENINFNTTKFQNSIGYLSVMKRFCFSLNQATLDVKYLFKNFHPILLIISILIVMTAYYQLNSVSSNNYIYIITATRTNARTIEISKKKENYDLNSQKRIYVNNDCNSSCRIFYCHNISNELKQLNSRRQQKNFIKR